MLENTWGCRLIIFLDMVSTRSEKLKAMSKIESHKIIYSTLKEEMKNKIHALEIEIK